MKPTLAVCPYLRLKKPVAIGPWEVGPLSSFDGRWPDSDFEKISKLFLSRFTDYRLKPLEHVSIVGRNGSGVSAELPHEDERQALQAALDCAAVCANSRFTLGAPGWDVITPDNAVVQWWPIDVADGHVTTDRGSMILHELSGGWTVHDEALRVPSPLEVFVGATAVLDHEVAAALFTLAIKHSGDPAAGRIVTAARWLSKAWQNTPAIRHEDRIVFVKTGFEALTDQSKSHLSAAALRQMFENALAGETVRPEWQLMWSPADKPSMARTWMKNGKPQTDHVTPLEHWFMEFADCRNRIIHTGNAGALAYAGGTAFDGPLFWNAEWILRLGIKLALVGFGFKNLWKSAFSRQLEKLGQEEPKA